MTTHIPFKWTASEQAWGLDANDFATANGLNPLFAADPNTGLLVLQSCLFQRADNGLVLARIDFSADPPNAISFVETLPPSWVPPADPRTDPPTYPVFARGNDINALVTQQIDGVEDELYSQIKGWFGLPQTGTSWPVCSGLSTRTAPTNAGYPGRGGQSYPMTPRGTVLIDPPPADWFRE